MHQKWFVVIPTYNRKKQVVRAIESVFSGLEPKALPWVVVIVVDDGSSDDTFGFLNTYFSTKIGLGQVHITSTLQKLGYRSGDPAQVRNQGVACARYLDPTLSSYVAFLDSDDYWGAGRIDDLNKQVQFFQAKYKQLPLAIFECIHAPVTHSYVTELGVIVRFFLKQNPVLTSGAVIKLDLITTLGGFREGYFDFAKRSQRIRFFRGFEDYDYWLRVVRNLASKNPAPLLLLPRSFVQVEHSDGGAGRLGLKEQMHRELITLLLNANFYFFRYSFTLYMRRMIGAIKAVVFH